MTEIDPATLSAVLNLAADKLDHRPEPEGRVTISAQATSALSAAVEELVAGPARDALDPVDSAVWGSRKDAVAAMRVAAPAA